MAKPKPQQSSHPRSSMNIKDLGEVIAKFFERFQTMIFFVIVGAGIAVAVLMIINIFTAQPTTPANTAPMITKTQEETVEALQQLESSESPRPLPAPSGRFSPFFEGGWDASIMK